MATQRKTLIKDLCHPTYKDEMYNWCKYRLTYKGGRDFIRKYLKKYSARETNGEFNARRDISYVNAQAKAAVIEVRNSIHSRMFEILRVGGPDSYQQAMSGLGGGVDLADSTMNNFMTTQVLDELLPMRRVGVFVDKPGIAENVTLRDTRSVRPYLYIYKTEDIRSWTYNRSNELVSVLLRDYDYEYYPETSVICGSCTSYRLLELVVDQETGNKIVRVTFFAKDSAFKEPKKQVLLNLDKIPFVIFEINQSLLTDIADYQIALTNTSSSDLGFIMNANFPFYTEQFDMKAELANMIVQGNAASADEEGTSKAANKAGSKQVSVGTTHGRRYPQNTERPAFIHPSSEPLKASIEKAEVMKAEVRQLLTLSLGNLAASRRASSESKQEDQKDKESGLGVIAFTLEAGEREIAEIWSLYEGSNPKDITVNYPSEYSLRSDEDRRKEATELLKELSRIPSLTAQKNMAFQAARLLIGTYVSNKDLASIKKEIEDAQVIDIDPNVIKTDHEEGLVSDQTASRARLYPDGEVDKARVDHTLRIARIQAAQATPDDNPAARGIKDLALDNKGAKEEKIQSQNRDTNPDNSSMTRGDAD